MNNFFILVIKSVGLMKRNVVAFLRIKDDVTIKGDMIILGEDVGDSIVELRRE